MLICQKLTRKMWLLPFHASPGERIHPYARRALNSWALDLGALMECVPFQGLSPSCGKRPPLDWQQFCNSYSWSPRLRAAGISEIFSKSCLTFWFDLMHSVPFLQTLHYQQRNKAEFALCSLSAVGFIGIHNANCVLKEIVNVDTASSLFNFLPFPRTSASIGCFFSYCHSSPDSKTIPNDVPSVLPSQYFLSALLQIPHVIKSLAFIMSHCGLPPGIGQIFASLEMERESNTKKDLSKGYKVLFPHA